MSTDRLQMLMCIFENFLMIYMLVLSVFFFSNSNDNTINICIEYEYV